jgi:putative flippase GtrA
LRVSREGGLAVRAALSSLLATVVDGLTYEGVLLVARHGSHAVSYGFASALGALFGGISNFTVNRYWVFQSRERSILRQGGEYAIGSLLTYAVLRTLLWVLIEKLGVDERLAWLPAKAVTWAVFSYPFQRRVVFSGGAR